MDVEAVQFVRSENVFDEMNVGTVTLNDPFIICSPELPTSEELALKL